MREAAPELRRDQQALAVELLAQHGVPEAELGALAPLGRAERAADDERFGADGAPILVPRRLVDVADLLDVGAGIDDLEQPGIDQVIGGHLGQLLGELRVIADEHRHGDRTRLECGLVDIAGQDVLRLLRVRAAGHCGAEGGEAGAGQNATAIDRRKQSCHGPRPERARGS